MADPTVPRSRPTAPSLVGRAREQATLGEALTAALAGHSSLVLIGGEAGIGKTALAEWTLAEAEGQGALVLVGRCYDLSETPPYGPWRELVPGYPAGGALPPLPALLAPGTTAALGSRDALVGQLLDWCAGAATARPLALLLEDLHWADQDSMDLLRVVARRASALRLLLLVTYRSDELTRRHPLYALLPLLEREAHAQRLDLHRFTAEGVHALVTARYALPEEDAARLVAWLVERAEGNAFFTTQLLRALADEGVLRGEADGWMLGDLGAVGLPTPLRQVLDARLARLGQAAQRLLAVAAIIGQDVPLDLWATVAETDEDGLVEAIDAAVQARLLAETLDGQGVRFAHALIREALYAGTLALRRRRMHRRVAEALVATPTPDPDAVAEHFRRAGDPRAVEWLVRASHRAEAAGALVSAAARAAAAEALLGDDPAQAERRAWLLYWLGHLARLDAPQRALASLEEAGRLAEATGNPALGLLARAERGYVRDQLGEFGSAEADLTAALAARAHLADAAWEDGLARGGALATPIGDGWPPAAWLASQLEVRRDTLTLLWAQIGRYNEALAQGAARLPPDAATADLRDIAPERYARPAFAGVLLLAVAHAHAALGRPEEALALFLTANRGGIAAHAHIVAARVFGFVLATVALPYRADRVAERRELAEAMLAEHRRSLDLGVGEGQPEALRHALDLLEGDWAAAERGALALRDGRRARPWAMTLGTLARRRGEAAAARSLVRAQLPDGPATAPGELSFLSALALIRLAALLAIDAGTLDTARHWLAAHDRWLAWSGAVLGRSEGCLAWAAYHRAAGDLAAAQEHAEAALARATEPRQPLALLAAHRLLGELDTDAGDHTDAETHLRESLALAEACAAPYERALTLLALAELHAATGDRDGAGTALAEARALLEPLAARPALARADALATRLTPPTAPAAPFGLSPREAEVLRLVARGLSNAQVAARLFLSPRTVDQHLRAIYGKLGVENRTAAAHRAVEHGLR